MVAMTWEPMQTSRNPSRQRRRPCCMPLVMYLWLRVGFMKVEFQAQFSVTKSGTLREGYNIMPLHRYSPVRSGEKQPSQRLCGKGGHFLTGIKRAFLRESCSLCPQSCSLDVLENSSSRLCATEAAMKRKVAGKTGESVILLWRKCIQPA